MEKAELRDYLTAAQRGVQQALGELEFELTDEMTCTTVELYDILHSVAVQTLLYAHEHQILPGAK